MNNLGRVLSALLVVAVGGCIKLDSFTCAQSSECQNGDVLGSCEVGGQCSFPDPLCPSGKKFGELAGEQSGQCVGEPGTTGDVGTTTPTSSPGPTTFEPTSTSEQTGTTHELTSTSEPLTTTLPTDTTDATTTTTDATTTTDPDTTTGAMCGALGEQCVNGECCGECTGCKDGTCSVLSQDQVSGICGGDCFTCGYDGQCTVAEPDQPCALDCSDIIHKQEIVGQKAVCFGYGAMPTTGTCDGKGSCAPPDPEAAKCPQSLESIVECDSACLLKDSGLCIPGQLKSSLSLESFCMLDGTTVACKPACSKGNLGLTVAECDALGLCSGKQQSCNGFYCNSDTASCPEKCEHNEMCVSNICIDGQC